MRSRKPCSIAQIAQRGESFIQTAFLIGGILHTEKQPQDLDLGDTKPTFDINFISHLLPIKTLFPLLPFVADEKIDGTA